jgi:diaminohydroxyphosphoribosylaminopyrimidine deaminase / 5-amino-6-(5-phosphoribosylamino)uracil reductase
MITPPVFSTADHDFMAQALRLAERGLWTTSPNPRVGCVVVKDGKIVGEGWHERAGEAHAEVHALRAAGEAARDATAYVTLEPCSHYGRTPPCAEALIAAGVKRVVAAMQDPNPRVAGRGLTALRAARIVAEVGLLEAAAQELNIGFVTRMTTGRPWVRVKLAASLDGRTALAEGESQWITGPDARRDGHRWRARACAILTGSGTVLGDDPQLTVRAVETERQPLRVVADGAARVPPTAHIFSGGPVLWITHDAGGAPVAHVERISLPGEGGHVDLPGLLDELGRRGINELHVEAGPRLAGILLRLGLVDELLLYLAPCLIGDTGRGLFGIPELASLADKVALRIVDVRAIGADIRVLARIA